MKMLSCCGAKRKCQCLTKESFVRSFHAPSQATLRRCWRPRGKVLGRSDDVRRSDERPNARRIQAEISLFQLLDLADSRRHNILPHDTSSRAEALIVPKLTWIFGRRRGIGPAAASGSRDNKSGRICKPVIDTIATLMKRYWCYIMSNKSRRLYVGFTNDPCVE